MPLDVVESPCQLALDEPKLDLLVLRRRQQLLESLLVPVGSDPRLGRNLAAVRGSDLLEVEEERGGEVAACRRVRDLGPRDDRADRARTIEADELRPCP